MVKTTLSYSQLFRHILPDCEGQTDRHAACSCYALQYIAVTRKNEYQLEVHSVERIYLRQRCFDASKPRVAASTGAQYQYVGFSRRNKIPRCSAYAMGESNPVPAPGLWSGSSLKVNQFLNVPTPVDTQMS